MKVPIKLGMPFGVQFAVSVLFCLGFLSHIVYAQTAPLPRTASPSVTAGEEPLLISDALVLDQERSEKVSAAYEQAQISFRETIQSHRDSMKSLSREERIKKLQELRTQLSTQFQTNLHEVLSEKELEMAQPFLQDIPRRRPLGLNSFLELRALRMIDLKSDQRATLQPTSVEFAKALILTPTPATSANKQNMVNIQETKKKAQKTFVDKANAILTDAQKTAWKEKTAELQESLQKQIESRRVLNERKIQNTLKEVGKTDSSQKPPSNTNANQSQKEKRENP